MNVSDLTFQAGSYKYKVISSDVEIPRLYFLKQFFELRGKDCQGDKVV